MALPNIAYNVILNVCTLNTNVVESRGWNITVLPWSQPAWIGHQISEIL